MRTSITPALLALGFCFVFSAADVLARPCKTPAICENAPPWKEGANYARGDRVLGKRGNLWACKGGRARARCDDAGHEPDVDAAAADAWQLVQQCFIPEIPEVSTTDIVVSAAQCPAAVTITAVVANASPFAGLVIPVAFYHSASKTLIGVAQAELVATDTGDPGLTEVSVVWNGPVPNPALITVVADDDGTGHGRLFEVVEQDNALSVTLATCP